MNVRNPRIAIVAAATAAATAATAAALIGAAPNLLDALDSRSAPVVEPVLAGRPPAGDVTEPVWVRALRLRSEALDRQYGVTPNPSQSAQYVPFVSDFPYRTQAAD